MLTSAALASPDLKDRVEQDGDEASASPPFPAHGCEEIRRRYGPSAVCVTAPASGLAAGVAVTHRRSRGIVC